jgi:hypothetical protein
VQADLAGGDDVVAPVVADVRAGVRGGAERPAAAAEETGVGLAMPQVRVSVNLSTPARRSLSRARLASPLVQAAIRYRERARASRAGSRGPGRIAASWRAPNAAAVSFAWFWAGSMPQAASA